MESSSSNADGAANSSNADYSARSADYGSSNQSFGAQNASFGSSSALGQGYGFGGQQQTEGFGAQASQDSQAVQSFESSQGEHVNQNAGFGGFSQQQGFAAQNNGFGEPQQNQGFGDQNSGFGQQDQNQGFAAQNNGFGEQSQNQGFGDQNSPFAAPAPQQNNQSAGTSSKGSGFFSALFDFSFKDFITLKFASVIYILVVALGAVFWVGTLLTALASFAQGPVSGVVSFLVVLIGGGIAYLLYIIQVRLILEFFAASIRTAQNTSELVAKADRDDTE